MYKSEAIKHFKRATRLAEALDVNKSTISNWPDIVPKGRAYEIYHMTKGAVALRKGHYKKLPLEE